MKNNKKKLGIFVSLHLLHKIQQILKGFARTFIYNSLCFCKSNIDDMIGEGWVPGIIPGEYNWKGMNQDPMNKYNIDVVTY